MCRVRPSGTFAKDCSPSKTWGTGLADDMRSTPVRAQVLRNQALLTAADRSRGSCSGHPTDAAALRRAFPANRECRRPVAPCAAALQRVEVMPEAYFKVRPERSSLQSARVSRRTCTAPWRGSVTQSFHDRSGPSLFAPPFTGGSQPTRRKETVQWPTRCLSTRHIRRRPGWSCCAATASRNSISRPRTANSFAAISISPR